MKEDYGNIAIVDGDVLDRRDLHPDAEKHRQRQNEDVDAERRGIEMRAARAREHSIGHHEAGAGPTDTLRDDSSEKDLSISSGIHIPREVMDLMIDAAYEEDRLRNIRVAPNRIDTIVGRSLSPEMIRLQFKNIDTSRAFGSSQRDAENNVHDLNSMNEVKIDALMDGSGMSYDEARRKVL